MAIQEKYAAGNRVRVFTNNIINNYNEKQGMIQLCNAITDL